MRMHAAWAVWSKVADDRDDYRVLYCSPGQRSRMEELLGRDRPGTPRTTQAGRPDSLPWVAIGSIDEPTTTVAIMDWTSDVDAAGRPITSTRFFVLPVAPEIAAASCVALYQAVADVHLPPMPTVDVVSVDVAPVDGRDVCAASLDRPSALDVHWTAAAAAVLLESRVVITNLAGVGPASCLATVDAIARMLPAGYRADLSMSNLEPQSRTTATPAVFRPVRGR